MIISLLGLNIYCPSEVSLCLLTSCFGFLTYYTKSLKPPYSQKRHFYGYARVSEKAGIILKQLLIHLNYCTTPLLKEKQPWEGL